MNDQTSSRFYVFELLIVLCVSAHFVASVNFHTLYEGRKNFSWRGGHPDQSDISALDCAHLCDKSDSCTGFTCRLNTATQLKNCHLCYLITAEKITQANGSVYNDSEVVNGSYSVTTLLGSTDSANANFGQSGGVYLPGGLRDGMVFYFKAILNYGYNVIYFHDNDDSYGKPQRTLLVHYSPVDIFLWAYDKRNQSYFGRLTFMTDDFDLDLGEEVELVVFISESAYPTYINGKFVCNFQRDTSYPLSHFKYLWFSNAHTSVTWFAKYREMLLSNPPQ